MHSLNMHTYLGVFDSLASNPITSGDLSLLVCGDTESTHSVACSFLSGRGGSTSVSDSFW